MTLCILGGGVAGLAAAHYALTASAFKKIVILESSSRLGGWIKTIRHSDGVLFEKGPRTVRPAGPQGANTLALVNEIGLAESVQPVLQSHPSSKNRLVLANGTLHKLPSNLASVFKKLPPFSRPLAFAAIKDLVTPRVKCEDISLYEFVSRRLGKDVADYAIDPMIRGICAGDSKQVSVHFIANYLHQCEQQTGRISFGVLRDYAKLPFSSPVISPNEKLDLVKRARSEKWAVWGLENGLETLIERLHILNSQNGVEIITNASVEDISLSGKKLHICYNSSEIACDKLIIAVPAFQAAQLVQGLSGDLSNILASIPFVDVAVVNLEFQGNVLDHQGFGFLVPSNQPEQLLGCIYDTCTFPQGKRTVLTAMIGGAWYQEMVGKKSKNEVEEMAIKEISKILKISQLPVKSNTSLLSQCIAQYTVGHRGRVAKARQVIHTSRLPISIAGSSYDGVGINDTIMSAKKAVIS